MTAIWAVIGAVLFAVGRQRMREVNPKPERTVETVKRSSRNPQGGGEEITMSTDPDQIRSEIDQTQRELSADVGRADGKGQPAADRGTPGAAYPHRDDEHEGQDHGQHIGRLPDDGLGGLGRRGRASAPGLPPRGTRWPRHGLLGRRHGPLGAGHGAAPHRGEPARGRPDRLRRRLAPVSLLPASEPEQQVASQVKDFATEQGRPVAEQLGEAGQQAAQELKESAQQRAETVKETAADAASTVTGEAQSAASDVTDQAQQAARVRDQG